MTWPEIQVAWLETHAGDLLQQCQSFVRFPHLQIQERAGIVNVHIGLTVEINPATTEQNTFFASSNMPALPTLRIPNSHGKKFGGEIGIG